MKNINIVMCEIVLIWSAFMSDLSCNTLPYFNVSLPEYFVDNYDVKVLIDSLESYNEYIRKCAAIRLGELRESNSIQPLINAYNNEPVRDFASDLSNGVRYFALTSIGKIGGTEAEDFLTNLANAILIHRQDLDWAKGDAIQIAAGMLDGLAENASEEDAKLLLEIFEDAELGYVTRRIAYSAYTRIRVKDSNGTITNKGLSNILDQMRLLAISDPHKSLSLNSPGRIKREALFTNLIELGIDNEQKIEEYRMGLLSSDPFAKELDSALRIIKNWKLKLRR